jgi:transposase
MKTEYVTIEKSEYEKFLKLAEFVPVLMAENEKLRAECDQLKAENKMLRDKVDMLVKRVFGSSSEKLDINQMMLNLGLDFEQALNEEDNDPDEPEPPPKSRKKRTPKKDRLPDNLPEERITIIPEEVQSDPDAYVRTGSQHTQRDIQTLSH